MSAIPTTTKKQYLKMAEEIEKNPKNRAGILGAYGITVMGMVGGGALTSVVGITSFLSLFGYSLLAISPAGWMITGGAVLGGAAIYGATKLVGSGGLAEGRKLELSKQYKEKAKEMEAKERACSITEEDRNALMIMSREVVEKDAISHADAFRLVGYVEDGTIPLSQAFKELAALLQNKGSK